MARGPKSYFQQPVIASPVIQQKGWRATDSYFTLIGARQCGVLMDECHNGSSRRSLFWEYDITNRMATKFPITAVSLRDKPGFSTTATKNAANPVNIKIYNLQLANNGSTVKCQLETEGSPAVILVEGILHCICTQSSLILRYFSLTSSYVCVLPPIVVLFAFPI